MNEDKHFQRELEKIRNYGVTIDYNDKPDSDNKAPEQPKSFNDKIEARVNLLWQMFFRNIPVEKAKGLDFPYELVLYDEFQDQDEKQADMLIKRLGKSGKIIITGDIKQIHAPYLTELHNGVSYAIKELCDTPMVARVSFLKEEVERHELVRLIAERQEKKTKTP